jgi:hypothetical protein
MSYPHPSANDPVQKNSRRPASTYALPPPNATFNGLQATDYAPHPGDTIHGFPSHSGGYRTTPDGLNIAGHPWNVKTKYPDDRQERANYEAMVASYWPSSQRFGPQGTNPSYNALLT